MEKGEIGELRLNKCVSDPISDLVDREDLVDYVRQFFGVDSVRTIKFVNSDGQIYRAVYVEAYLADLQIGLMTRTIKYQGNTINFHPAEKRGLDDPCKPRINLTITY